MSKPTLSAPPSREALKTRTKRQNTSSPLLSAQPVLREASHANIWIYLALIVLTIAVYAPVHSFDFVGVDDPADVSGNLHVNTGLSGENIKWAFTSGDGANWIPLTRMSHMLDSQLFGLDAGFHHQTNVLFHVLAVILLFAFLNSATGARWPSAFVALLFALHPLHVESVAWIAERKDVLSAVFWFLTLWTYARYAEHPTPRSYAIVLLSFALGLMSKPMVVTLPFVLLLVDIWPLRRLALNWKQAVWEKVPFFALAAVASFITYVVQRNGGAVKALSEFPVSLRIENALVTYVVYALKMFWPTRLAVFYPYPTSIPVWEPAAAAAAIAAVSVWVLRSLRERPYLAVGWLWFLGTLVPVIGLVQVGVQARADRYMYIPMVGLGIMLAWGASEVLAQWPQTRTTMQVAAAAAGLGMLVLTATQIQFWKNTETVFQHAINVTGQNFFAHKELGAFIFAAPGRLQEAMGHLEEAVRIRPDDPESQNDLGLALTRSPGRMPDAIARFETAVQIWPGYVEGQKNLAGALIASNRLPDAIPHYEAALRADPSAAEVHSDLGVALMYIPGRMPDAISHLETASRMRSDFDTEYYLGQALLQTSGERAAAIQHLNDAVRLKPGDASAHYELGLALMQVQGRAPESRAQFEAALRIRPDYQNARQALEQMRLVQP